MELTLTRETPLSARAAAEGLLGSLVIPRSWNCSASTGSFSTVVMTEPPWLPVAPKTTSIFIEAMLRFLKAQTKSKVRNEMKVLRSKGGSTLCCNQVKLGSVRRQSLYIHFHTKARSHEHLWKLKPLKQQVINGVKQLLRLRKPSPRVGWRIGPKTPHPFLAKPPSSYRTPLFILRSTDPFNCQTSPPRLPNCRPKRDLPDR